ncbi:DUF916 and DUF3324 domain-containing protein [Brochothrix thermosphacta]|uniref:DUF916 and DUF3324 domain-containing protein n=1 Tax=Brochothrix thermosphacta TaxID=2756 RepID=UPI000EA3E9B1|nr:DUF916 and DUF3324 domain-containing protein [Brochothrix thermosphacta]
MFICSLFFIATGKVDATSGGHGFSVTPINKNKNSIRAGYFEIETKPDKQEVLSVKITNGSDNDMKIKVELNNATTNDNGITAYDATTKKDTTLKTGFSDIATIKEDTVLVKKDSSTVVDIKVSTPKEQFDGVILGGLRFSDVETEKKSTKETSAVSNNISYVIGVVLQETPKPIIPKMALNKVGADQRNYRNYISANLQNTEPVIIKELSAHAKVTKKGDTMVLYEASKNKMRMAPNSNFNFGINLENQALIPGKYLMDISGESDGIPYSFTKEFEIQKKEANDLNENSVFIKKENNTWLYVFIILGLIIVIGLIIYLIYRKSKQKRIEEGENVNEE